MPKLAAILSDKRILLMEVGESETLTITYRPSAFTPEMEDRFFGSVEASRAGTALAGFLAEVLIGWDLEDETVPYPVTEESLRKLPISFLGAVVTAITTDMRPSPQKAAGSAGGSLAAV